MEVIRNRPFYILILNSTNADICTAKHTVIGQSSNTFSTMIDPEVTCEQSIVDDQPKTSTNNIV